MKMYKVDNGDGWTSIMGEKTLRQYYNTKVDHNIDCGGYPDFEGWLYDMKRCGLVTEL